MGARACATGQDIHFGAGEYKPEDPFGMHLLAHEVAHTVQQGAGGGGPQTKLEVSEPGDALEGEADHAADAMVRGEAASVSQGAPAAARTVHRFLDGAFDAVKDAVTSVLTPPEVSGPAPAAGGGARPMLTVGSRGPAVIELQQKLGIAADGAFGPGTRAAVVAFQQSHGLVADGVVGGQTWAAVDGGGHSAAPAKAAAPAAAPAAASASAPASAEQQATGDRQQATDNATTPASAAVTDEAAAGGAGASIVAAARSKLGTIASNQSGGVDETGEKTRKGYESLQEIFGVALPAFPPQIVKYLKYGKNSDASNPTGLPSWCGIFATWAVMVGGGNCDGWQGGNRVDNLKKLTKDPQPGDVGNFAKNNHYCIIAAVNGDSIETIDGNSFDGETGGDGSVAVHTRSKGEFRAFFRQT
jgi:peptidoglycan hydrolase-like protein with peptidoglycan-binding domain